MPVGITLRRSLLGSAILALLGVGCGEDSPNAATASPATSQSTTGSSTTGDVTAAGTTGTSTSTAGTGTTTSTTGTGTTSATATMGSGTTGDASGDDTATDDTATDDTADTTLDDSMTDDMAAGSDDSTAMTDDVGMSDDGVTDPDLGMNEAGAGGAGGEMPDMGAGGMPDMGAGGMAGETMDDGPAVSDAVEPSAGCGSPAPGLGSSQSPLNVSNHQYYVKIPDSYSPDTPYPVIFMFHPTNNPLNWAEQNGGFERNGAKDAAIRVYPGAGNNASGWGSSDVSFFQPLYDEIVGSFCVDQARVFAAGESSGGDFSSILGCEHADKIRAIGPCATKPVGGYPLNADQRNCTGQVGAVIIHGKNDNVVGPENGPATRDFYVALNHCTMMSAPLDGYTDNQSNCVQFDGCDDGFPVIWCQHEDPEYSGTNHGWPKFAGNMLWEHFSSY